MTVAVAGFTPPRPPRRATGPHTLIILRAIARSTIGGWSEPAFANPVTVWRHRLCPALGGAPVGPTLV